MNYKRLTKLSDLGTLHAMDFNGEEQPLCELTALDIDVLIRRLYELENKIESGELVNVKEIGTRMEITEMALLNACKDRVFTGCRCCSYKELCDNEHHFELDEDCTESAEFCKAQYIKQAEKELEEEKK